MLVCRLHAAAGASEWIIGGIEEGQWGLGVVSVTGNNSYLVIGPYLVPVPLSYDVTRILFVLGIFVISVALVAVVSVIIFELRKRHKIGSSAVCDMKL